MIKRTIEISQQSAHLSVRLDQLLIQPHDQPKESGSSIPCEDLGMVVVDHPRCTYSHAALAKLSEFGAVLVVCGRDHLPAGVLLPLAEHGEVVWRIRDQIAISKPLKKQLWKQIVQAKVRAQAANLFDDSPERGRLLALARAVRSGDPTNIEAQAAKIYWSTWLQLPSPELPSPAGRPGDSPVERRGVGGEGEREDLFPSPPGRGAGGEGPPVFRRNHFRRNQKGKDPLNLMLNYGYAILRAAVARAIVAAGLHPVLGLHHHQRSNAFCLADDLLEPLRPVVDRRVRELYVNHGRRELNQPTKAGLLELLTRRVRLGDEKGPLMVALHRMVASLVKCYEGSSRELAIPVLDDEDEAGSC